MKNDLGSYYDKNGSVERYPRCYYHKVAIKIYWHVWVCRPICMPSHDRPSSVLNVHEISGRRRLTVNPSNFPFTERNTYIYTTFAMSFRYLYIDVGMCTSSFTGHPACPDKRPLDPRWNPKLVDPSEHFYFV
ncbi:hypothetical protein PV325_014040 [Microctonus aethiopoides]|nr:hypothetical protein PV325_014040 [Microctonus aethiopoides]